MLYIIRGLPGSGKSTLAKNLYIFGLVDYHFEADMYFIDAEGNYKFDPSKLKDAHAWCQEAVRGQIEGGDSVAVSNTFTQMWEMEPYLDMAKELGVKTSIITVEGNYGSIHNVPEEAITRMRNRWEKYNDRSNPVD